MMKKYTQQMSVQDEGVTVEHQICQQYSRQQCNPDATSPTPDAAKKEETKEAEEEVNHILLPHYLSLFVDA